MLKNVTIKDICKFARRNGESVFGLTAEKSVDDAKDIASAYERMHTDVDRRMARENGMFSPAYNSDECLEDELLEEYSNDDECVRVVLEEFQQTVQSYLNTRSADYKHIFAIQDVVYKAEDNYNMTERSTDTHANTENEKFTKGEQNDKMMYGELRQNTTYGEQTVTTETGERMVTSDYGEQNTSSTTGDRNNTQTSAVAGFNSSDFQNSTRTSSTEDGYVDKEKVETHTDTTKEEAVTDRQTTSGQNNSSIQSEHTDANIFGARTDTNERTGSSDITHELTRTGNIGVTTTQQMLESEVKLWERYDFWGRFMEDVVSRFCTFHDDGFSPLHTPYVNELFPFL